MKRSLASLVMLQNETFWVIFKYFLEGFFKVLLSLDGDWLQLNLDLETIFVADALCKMRS